MAVGFSIARGATAQRLSPGTTFGVFAVGVDVGATALLNSLSNEAKIAARELTVAGKGINLFNTGLKAGVIALGLSVAGIGLAAQATNRFREELVQTAAILDQDIDVIFDKIGLSAIELSKNLGFSASEIQSAGRQLGQSGFNAEEIQQALKPLLQFTLVTGAEIPDAVDLATKVIRGFKLEVEDIDHVFNTFMLALNRAPATIDDLKLAFRQVTPIAGQLGISLESVTAAIAAVTRAGLSGESAGTSFATGLQKILDPAEQSTDKMKSLIATFKIVLQQTGDVAIATDQFLKAAFGPDSGIAAFGKTIQELKKDAGIASFAEESDAAIEALADRFEGIDLIVELFTVKSSKFWLDYIANAEQARIETIAMKLELASTEEAAEKALQSISVQMSNLRNQLVAPLLEGSFAEDLVNILEEVNESGDLERLGEVFANFAGTSLKTLAGSLDEITELLEGLGGVLQALSISTAAFLGVINPVLKAFNALPPGLTGSIIAFVTLNKLFGPLITQTKAFNISLLTNVRLIQIEALATGKSTVEILKARTARNASTLAIRASNAATQAGVIGLIALATGNKKVAIGLGILSVALAFATVRYQAMALGITQAAYAASVLKGILNPVSILTTVATVVALGVAFAGMNKSIKDSSKSAENFAGTSLDELEARAKKLRDISQEIQGIKKNEQLSTADRDVFDINPVDKPLLFNPSKNKDDISNARQLLADANRLDAGEDANLDKFFTGSLVERIAQAKIVLQNELLTADEKDKLLAVAFGEDLARSIASGIKNFGDIEAPVATTFLNLTPEGKRDIEAVLKQIRNPNSQLGKEFTAKGLTEELLKTIKAGGGTEAEKQLVADVIKGRQFEKVDRVTLRVAEDIKTAGELAAESLKAFHDNFSEISNSLNSLIESFEGVQIVNGKYVSTASLLNAAGVEATASLKSLKAIQEKLKLFEFVTSITEFFDITGQEVPEVLTALSRTLSDGAHQLVQEFIASLGLNKSVQGTLDLTSIDAERESIRKNIAARQKVIDDLLQIGPPSKATAARIAAMQTVIDRLNGNLTTLNDQAAAVATDDTNIFAILADSGGFKDFNKLGLFGSFSDATTDTIDGLEVATSAFGEMSAQGLDVASALNAFKEFTIKNKMLEITNQLIGIFQEFGTGVPQEFANLQLTLATQLLGIGQQFATIFDPSKFDAESIIEIWAKALESPQFTQNNNIIVRVSAADGTENAASLADNIVRELRNRGTSV